MKKLFKSVAKTVLSIIILGTPVLTQAFPLNGLMVANSMTFTTFTITIVSGAAGKGSNAYSPDTITLTSSADSVIWHNADTFHHTATCGSGSPCGMWSTGTVSGSAFSARFGASSFALGTTGYYCVVHGYPSMYGGIIKKTVSVEDWEKMSSADKEKALEVHPIKNAFGLIFVPPNDSAATKSIAINAVQQNKDAIKVSSTTVSPVGSSQ